ncbi:multidrug DMT transporter permease [Tistrella bauzanensis]|uniref:Multidrug DMT transporter permease n=1 Tax=Tistrella bauzanensis TaxID=657419 RepID=A0ABQ1IJL9_9PROT|nr:DMT family transporter [Tistrella bauzanensis]GGB42870.1 multidrug DMT transporter permease [Tistrella bauzanensis]
MASTSEGAMRPAPRGRLDAGAAAMMVVLCACWGLQQAIVKLAVADGAAPLSQAALRSVGATLIVGVVVLGLGRRRGFVPTGTVLPGIGAGLLFALEFALLYTGVSLTTASRAIIFLYVAPFVVAIGGHLMLPGERLGRWQVLGLISAFAGIIAAFADGLFAGGGSLLGDLLMVGAAIAWGATTLLIKASTLSRTAPLVTLLYQLAVSAVALPLLALAHGADLAIPLTTTVVLSMGFQIVIVASLSYLGWFVLISRYPASRLSAFSFLTPLFGVAAAALILGDTLTPAFALAMVLVAGGIWMVNRPG